MQIPEEVLAAAQHLIQMGLKHKALVIGFVLSEEQARPFIMPFGTVKSNELTDVKLYAAMCELAKHVIDGPGEITNIHVGRPE